MKVSLRSTFHSAQIASNFLAFLRSCAQTTLSSDIQIRGSVTAQKGQEFTVLRSPHVHKKGREKFRSASLYTTRFSLELPSDASFPLQDDQQRKALKGIFLFLSCLPEAGDTSFSLTVQRIFK